MTDIELLPLPPVINAQSVQDYARAVAEHNVRFLAHELANAECAIDAEQAGRKKAEAEIEALREEKERWRILCNGESARRMDAEDRAERLAEALRLALDSHGKTLLTDPPQDAWKVNRVEEIGRAALRDHDQEGKDAT